MTPLEEKRKDIDPYPDTNAAMTAAQPFYAKEISPPDLQLIADRLFRSGATGIRVVISLIKAMPTVNPLARLLVINLAARFLLVSQRREAPPNGDLLQGLAALLNHPDLRLRTRAVKILIALGPQSAPIQTGVLGCLRHADPQVRLGAAKLLQALGPACDRGNGRQMKTAIERFPNDAEFCHILSRCMASLNTATAIL